MSALFRQTNVQENRVAFTMTDGRSAMRRDKYPADVGLLIMLGTSALLWGLIISAIVILV